MGVKNNILINIPHSSVEIPTIFKDNLLINNKYLESELKILTDLYTDDLFFHKDCNIIKASFSRLFCDVERFKNDEEEIMSKIGMGVIYQKTTKGDSLISCSKEYKENVIKNYYDKYHEELNNIATKIIQRYSKCVIIDAHSFSEELLSRIGKRNVNIPDVCLGFEERFYDFNIIKCLKEYFEQKGLSVMLNEPYSGSIIPNKYYKSKEFRIKSVMIEVNKKLYLDEDCRKNINYINIKNTIQEAIGKIIEVQRINYLKKG